MNSPLVSTFKGKYLILSKTVTSNYSFDELIEDLNVDATSGPITITLPAISSNIGRHVSIRKIDSSANIVTVQTAGGDLLQGNSSVTLGTQWAVLSINNDNIQWHISAGDGTVTSVSAEGIFYYVSVAHGLDTNNGFTPQAAVATIAHAQTLLGSAAGGIFLLAGTHMAPSGGILLQRTQSLHGVGGGASKIDGSAVTSASYVVKAGGSRSAIYDIWVTSTPANKTAIRVSVTGPSTSTENVIVQDCFVDSLGTNGVAYGIGDDTGFDVSEIILYGCSSVGNSTDTRHLVVGNGGTGNVLDLSNFGGNAQGHQYGIVIAGAALVSHGLNFQFSSVADIWLKNNVVGNITISGGRSEHPIRFLQSDFGGNTYNSVKISEYTVAALDNTDGRAITMVNGPICLENILLFGSTCPQFISTSASADTTNGLALEAKNCGSEHPYLFRSPWSRPGKLLTTMGTKFAGNPQANLFPNKKKNNRWVRRYNVIDGSNFSLDASYFEDLEIRLHANQGTFSLVPGTFPGQLLKLTFVQDGLGTRTWTWPALCAFDGNTPPMQVTTPLNRQSVQFEWSGQAWEQIGSAINRLPLTIASNPITENFSSGNPFWLQTPSGGGAYDWESVPGGGSMGINAGTCVTRALGWVGDLGGDDSDTGLFGALAAGYVIESGMATQTTGVSATFTWHAAEGVLVHYLDDQTFLAVILENAFSNGYISVSGFVNGVNISPGAFFYQSAQWIFGSTHTLLVKCTSTGLDISVDGGSVHTTSFGGNAALWTNFSKHGIISSSIASAFTSFSVA